MSINCVAICPNETVRNALIKAIRETSGIGPQIHSSSESADRAHYAPAEMKLIINCASERMHEILGKHSIALAVETADRVAAAKHAKAIFEAAGIDSTIHTQAEPEFPDELLAFLAVPALQGITLMFWPRPEDVTPELRATLPERKPWDSAIA